MSLDTVKVQLKPQDAIALLVATDKRGDEWMLMPTDRLPAGSAGRMAPRSIILSVCVDQEETCHQIVLNIDGTWTASTHIELGEAK
jgi:hypothetical protein